LNWNVSGKCALTIIEEKLRKGVNISFFNNMVKKITGLVLTTDITTRINYIIFILWWLWLLYRFMNTLDISMFHDHQTNDNDSIELNYIKDTLWVKRTQVYTLLFFILIFIISIVM